VGIALVRLPAYNLNLAIYAGRIDRDELLGFYQGIDVYDPVNGAPMVNYMDVNVDLSSVDLLAFSELKRILSQKLKALAENNPGFHCIIICNSEQCQTITRFWRAYVQRDPTYASPPIFFPNLKSACDWLQLEPSAYDAARDAIRASQAQAPPIATPERVGGAEALGSVSPQR
jgi:hypothetical protein